MRVVLEMPPSPESAASTQLLPDDRGPQGNGDRMDGGGSWPSGALRDPPPTHPVVLSLEKVRSRQEVLCPVSQVFQKGRRMEQPTMGRRKMWKP